MKAFDLTGLGGRRFLISLISGAGSFLLCWAGKIDGNAYVAATLGIVGAYIVGNVAQKKIESQEQPQ
mgnify:CR=1 FL=1